MFMSKQSFYNIEIIELENRAIILIIITKVL